MSTTGRSSRIGFLTAIGGLALVLAACSSSGASTAPSAAAPSAAAPSAAAASAAAAGGETYTVAVATGAVGSYLTGEDGKTLYVFKDDRPGSGKSTCGAGCVGIWPPFTVESKDQLKAGAGVSGTLDVITRDDGTKQVTYKGAPLYYYSGDTKAGQTGGQGLFGKWFVANP